MESPPIRYVRTRDDVAIAYSVLGDGPPLVYLQPYTHQALDWTVPELAEWFGLLAQRHQLVRMDTRGIGLSSSAGAPFSVDDLVDDLTAVVDAIGLTRFDLVGISGLGLPAIQFSVCHPQRVERLVLWGALANGSTRVTMPRSASVLFTAEHEPELALELISRQMFGRDGPSRPECVAHNRAAVTIEGLRRYLDTVTNADLTPILGQIRAPTLVARPTDNSVATPDALRIQATRIPDSVSQIFDADMYPHNGGRARERLGPLLRFLSAEPSDSVSRRVGALTGRGPRDLSPRETEVLHLVVAGRSNPEIAGALSISPNTVARHLNNIYRKLHVTNRVEAVTAALQPGVPPDDGPAAGATPHR